MVAEKIKQLREKNNFTQSALAKKLDLARLFQVSTDYLLGLNETATLDISMLNDKETIILYELVQYFKSLKWKV